MRRDSGRRPSTGLLRMWRPPLPMFVHAETPRWWMLCAHLMHRASSGLTLSLIRRRSMPRSGPSLRNCVRQSCLPRHRCGPCRVVRARIGLGS